MSNKQSLKAQSSFSATLSIISDWHVGSGTGISGDIDKLVQRDTDGLPYIPAKTLTGIWRDACEIVARGLDNGTNGNWSKWVEYLFGEQPAVAKGAIETPPRPAALSIRSAYLPDNLRQALKQKLELKNAVTFVKPGISIDPESGCAKQDFLRFEEMVRGGTSLNAKCELTLPQNPEQQLAAYALLIAGGQFIERLGGKRRRGAGKCKLAVEKDINPWINWLQQHPQAPPIPDLDVERRDTAPGKVENQTDNSWVSVKLRVKTESPVIISKRTVGNVVESLDYIPGTHLLRLVRRRLSKLNLNIDPAIACGQIIVTNATVEIDNQQGKPVPLCLFSEKATGGLSKGGKIYNRFVENEPEGQLKGERAGYINFQSQTIKHKTVNLCIDTHNTVEDQYQRPTSDVGGVYSYQAIQSNTILQAEIRLCSSLAKELSKQRSDWWNLLKGSDRIGQSKKDNYGAVRLEVLGNPAQLSANTDVNNSHELTVLLLSDVLLRDERLRPTTSIDCLAAELAKLLEVDKLTIRKDKDNKLSLMARQNRIDSWQVRWGLPRPSLVGLSAGSCMVFTVEGNLDPNKLAEITARGIGDRRSEGYGQICFNHPLITLATSNLQVAGEVQLNSSSIRPELIKPSDLTFNYARIIEREAWREAIRKTCLFLVSSEQSRAHILGIKITRSDDELKSEPPMSQLGGLRSILSRLQTVTDANRAIAWLVSLEATPNRKDKWSKTDDALGKIRNLISNQNRVWQILNIDSAKITLTATGQQDLKNELWAEAVRTLVDACIRAHKRDCEG